MSAKRELSSTLKNLKFMQRAMPKQAKPKEEEEKPKVDGGFGPALARKCTVIMEGNPHPGAVRGRMSFQGFNPAIDKLNEEAAESSKPRTSFSVTENQNGECSYRSDLDSNRENGSTSKPDSSFDTDLKRKTPETRDESSPMQTMRNFGGDGRRFSSEDSQKDHKKQQKREKLDWNVLKREKANTKRD